jgi:hypothetical protein
VGCEWFLPPGEQYFGVIGKFGVSGSTNLGRIIAQNPPFEFRFSASSTSPRGFRRTRMNAPPMRKNPHAETARNIREGCGYFSIRPGHQYKNYWKKVIRIINIFLQNYGCKPFLPNIVHSPIHSLGKIGS